MGDNSGENVAKRDFNTSHYTYTHPNPIPATTYTAALHTTSDNSGVEVIR